MAGQAVKKSAGQGVASLSQKVGMNGAGGPNRWEIRLGFPQLLTIWGLFLGLTIIVFLVGFYTGRDRGQKLALEDRDVPSLRLPITEQTVTSDSTAVPVSTGVIEPLPTIASASGVLNPFVESRLKQQNSDVDRGSEPKANFDFSQAAMNVTREASVAKPSASEGQHPLRAVEKESVPTARAVDLHPVVQPAAERSPMLAQIEKEALAKEPKSLQVAKPRDLPREEKPEPVSVKSNKPIEKPKPEAKKPTPAKNSTKAGEKGWFVQLAASDTRNEANTLAGRVRAKGLPATIKEARVDGVLYFRVLVGPFKSKAGADHAKSTIGRGMGKGQPFVKNY